MLNWARVEELRGEVGEDAFAEVVDLFLEEVVGVIDALDPGMEPAAMEEALHFLKGASMNLGFDTFSDMCAKGELAARRGDLSGIDVPAIQECYALTQVEFMTQVQEKGYLAA